MKKDYLLDDEPIDFVALIQAAKELGYEGDCGMFFTSGAASVLRAHGHTVKENRATK